MFRRSKSAATSSPGPSLDASGRPTGKGRPTPSRREAQAAAKARAKAPVDRKSASRQQRARRAQSTAKVREGMRTGDERYLPARDKGPVRRFVRDYIDARLCVAELLLPLLLVIMVTSVFATSLSNGLWSATILLVALDTSLIVFRLRRELPRRFPDERTKGAVLYGVMRSIQLRWIRLPKPRVKLGAKLPARY
ncbi:MAG: DUF3043 domain-containing protein [Nocardioidaceae bacterium]